MLPAPGGKLHGSGWAGCLLEALWAAFCKASWEKVTSAGRKCWTTAARDYRMLLWLMGAFTRTALPGNTHLKRLWELQVDFLLHQNSIIFSVTDLLAGLLLKEYNHILDVQSGYLLHLLMASRVGTTVASLVQLSWSHCLSSEAQTHCRLIFPTKKSVVLILCQISGWFIPVVTSLSSLKLYKP